MSLAMGLIGGLGQGAANIADQNTKAWADQDLERMREQAILDREKAIARLKVELQDAPLNRLGDRAKALIGEQVPVEAAPVKSLTGAGAPVYPDGEQSAGLQGDPAALRAQVGSWPDGPDKTAALAQLDQQMTAEKDKNQQAVAGQMRNRTPGEALSEAANRSQAEDPVAYAEYEAKIGKPLRDERRLDQSAEQAGARLDNKLQVQQLRNEAMNARTQAQLDIAQAKLEAAIAKAGNGGTDFDKKIKLLKESGATDKEIANFITERKQPSVEDLAVRLLTTDPNAGTKKALTEEDAFARAKKIRALTSTFNDTPNPATPPASAVTPPASGISPPKVLKFDPATGTFN